MSRPTTYDRILEAAERCFRESGIWQTSVLDIVARASVGRSTFYRAFRDIDDILVTLGVGIWNRHLPALRRALTNPRIDARARWRDFIVSLVTIPDQSDPADPMGSKDVVFHIVRLLYGPYADKRQQVVDSLAEIVDGAKTRGELRTDVGSPQIAEWILRQAWSLSSLPLSDVDNPGRWPRPELGAYIETFLLMTIMRPKTADETWLGGEVSRLVDAIDRLERIRLSAMPVND